MKVFYEGLESRKSAAEEITKVPRCCVMPVMPDSETGIINCAPYTAGVVSVDPLILAMGIMSPNSQNRIREIDVLTLGVPSHDQVDAVWIAASKIPDGIDELEVLGWHTFQEDGMPSPGIKECRMNLQCTVLSRTKLPDPWRMVVLLRVTDVFIDSELAALSRAEVLECLPILEGGMHVPDGVYGMSTFSGEASGKPAAAGAYQHVNGVNISDGRYHLQESKFAQNRQLSSLAVFPSPIYIVTALDSDGTPISEVVEYGHLQSSQPCLHVPLPKESKVLARIRETGVFGIDLPVLAAYPKVAALRERPGTDAAASGFTPGGSSMFHIPTYTESEVSMSAERIVEIDVPDCDKVLLVAAKVGVAVDDSIEALLDLTRTEPEHVFTCFNEVYSRFLFHALDLDGSDTLVRYGGDSTIAFRSAPSWGNHLAFPWNDGTLNDWLMELVWMKLLTKWEYEKILNELMIWNDAKGIEYLRKYYPEGEMEKIRKRLTRLLHMMMWAHRSPWKWDRVRAFLETFPDPYLYKGHHTGPMHMQGWDVGQYI